MYAIRSYYELVNSIPIAFIPEDISQSFPSRGMLMARVEISGISFVTPLEPDGEGSHFFICPESIVSLMKGESLNDINLVLLSSSEWPDPDLPNDFVITSYSIHYTKLYEFFLIYEKHKYTLIQFFDTA